MTEKDGDVVWKGRYYPFGELYYEWVSAENYIRFPGQWEDEETDLYYNWHRYYDPTTGRYTQADPIGLAGGMNLYAYVGNNPTGRIDPYGLAWWLSGNRLVWYDYWPPAPVRATFYAEKLTYNYRKEDGTIKDVILSPKDKAEVFLVDKEFNNYLFKAKQSGFQLSEYPQLLKHGAMALLYLPGMYLDIKSTEGMFLNTQRKYLVYKGQVYRADDLGNLLFGYGAKAAGYFREEILMYAGLLAVLRGKPGSGPYYDEVKDQYYIRKGIDLYDREENCPSWRF